MKLEPIEVEIIAVRPYAFKDSVTGETRSMIEVTLLSPDGEIMRTSKRVYEDSEPIVKGKYLIQFTVIPDKLLKPVLGTIHF